jgi:hypothetical protein
MLCNNEDKKTPLRRNVSSLMMMNNQLLNTIFCKPGVKSGG